MIRIAKSNCIEILKWLQVVIFIYLVIFLVEFFVNKTNLIVVFTIKYSIEVYILILLHYLVLGYLTTNFQKKEEIFNYLIHIFIILLIGAFYLGII